MKDFFVSYNSHDRDWAEWIAWTLEEGKYTVVIQHWDFVGNWVLEMDRAMRGTERTVAVLSQHYLDALYTQPEWADAALKDPTGDKDLLIPFKIAECKPEGWLAQVAWTPLIGLSEEQAVEAVLTRVRRQRRKPGTKPPLPRPNRPSIPLVERVMPRRPAYPAGEEDLLRFQRFRVIARDWRARYATRVGALRSAAQEAESKKFTGTKSITADVVRVFDLAMEAAEDFMKLPIDELRFASAYGLSVHGAVLEGTALSIVQMAHRTVKGLQKTSRTDAELRAAFGSVESRVSGYDFESAARVLDSAAALCSFDATHLPRGFVDARSPVPPNDLRGRELVVTCTGDERLHLVDPATSPKPLASFAARALRLDVVVAQVNTKGTLDLVAADEQHLYYWSDSASAPIAQARIGRHLIAGAFLAAEPGSDALAVDADGEILLFSPQGPRRTFASGQVPEHIAAAVVWIDPLEPSQWCAVIAGHDGDLLSFAPGRAEVYRADLWDDAGRLPPARKLGPLWTSHVHLLSAPLDGLPCIAVERGSQWGPAICFVDPQTLKTLRRPARLPNRPTQHIPLAMANGRWLLATCNPDGNRPIPRLAVWDLSGDVDGGTRPAGAWFDAYGDIYDTLVLTEIGATFTAAVVFSHFETGPKQHRRSLCIAGWPDGTANLVADYPDLRLWPVRQAPR